MSTDEGGGAARPRRTGRLVVVGAVVAVVLVGGFFAYRHLRPPEPPPGKPVGAVCAASDECAEGTPCIRESTGESYCAKLCETDDDCSAAFVCEPTRSLLRHACMKAGVQIGFATGGNPVYRRVRESSIAPP